MRLPAPRPRNAAGLRPFFGRGLAFLAYFFCAAFARSDEPTVDFGGIELKFPVPEGMTKIANPGPLPPPDLEREKPSAADGKAEDATGKEAGVLDELRKAVVGSTSATDRPPRGSSAGGHRIATFRAGTSSVYAAVLKDDHWDHRFVTPELLHKWAGEYAAKNKSVIGADGERDFELIVRNEDLILIPRLRQAKTAAVTGGLPKPLILWVYAYARINGRLVMLWFHAPYDGDQTLTQLTRQIADYVAAVRKTNEAS